LLYDLNCTGSRAYLDLAREFLQREGLLPGGSVKVVAA
jgi:DUF1680 family protein